MLISTKLLSFVCLRVHVCAGTSTDYEPACGRPHGIRLDHQGQLIVADSYLGLHSVNPKTGEKTVILANSQGNKLIVCTQAKFVDVNPRDPPVSGSPGAGGVPFAFLNGLEISSQTGIIYFTDSSSRWGRRHVKLEVRQEPDQISVC